MTDFVFFAALVMGGEGMRAGGRSFLCGACLLAGRIACFWALSELHTNCDLQRTERAPGTQSP